MTGIICPSYRGGFASPQRGRLKYPTLWRGCVGAWAPLLGQSGTILRDNSGFGNHGTLTNMGAATDWSIVGGKYSVGCLGTNDHIQTNKNFGFSASSNFSVCGWINPSSIADFPTVISCRNGATYEWQLRIASNASFLVTSGSTVGATSLSARVNTWIHLGASYSNGTVTIFLDGRSDGSGTGRSITNSGISTVIGNIASVEAPHSSRGYLDDIRVYNRALSQSEWLALGASERRRGIAYETVQRRSYAAATSRRYFFQSGSLFYGFQT